VGVRLLFWYAVVVCVYRRAFKTPWRRWWSLLVQWHMATQHTLLKDVCTHE
jgi:hypothetical protein